MDTYLHSHLLIHSLQTQSPLIHKLGPEGVDGDDDRRISGPGTDQGGDVPRDNISRKGNPPSL